MHVMDGVGSRNFVSLNSINLHDLPVKIPTSGFQPPDWVVVIICGMEQNTWKHVTAM